MNIKMFTTVQVFGDPNSASDLDRDRFMGKFPMTVEYDTKDCLAFHFIFPQTTWSISRDAIIQAFSEPQYKEDYNAAMYKGYFLLGLRKKKTVYIDEDFMFEMVKHSLDIVPTEKESEYVSSALDELLSSL